MTYNHRSASASLRGRQNRAEGNAFEEIIEAACDYYRKNDIADIDKTPEPVRVLSEVDSRGQFRACFEKQAQPDYKGVIKGGQCIVFDAKCTSTEKIQLSALTNTQLETLINYHRLGAISGVLMCFSFKNYYFMPINLFLHAKEYNGHKWWTPGECDLRVSPCPYGYKGLDFLANEVIWWQQ